MTDLGARILDLLASSPIPLAANEIGHRLDEPVADVLIALHTLMQSDQVVSRVKGVRQRRYYEVADDVRS